MFGIDPVEFLQSYGYLALLVGTFLEGETIVIIAGFLAHQGLLSPPLIALCAFCGSVTSDQLMFVLGRWKGMAIIQRFEKLEKKMAKAAQLLSKYETPLILGFRFIYGVRNVTPILMGLSGVNHVKFLVLNVIGAAVWAMSFTAAGYFFGEAVTAFLDAVPHGGRYILGGMVALAAFIWLRHKWRVRKRKQMESLEPANPVDVTVPTPSLKVQDETDDPDGQSQAPQNRNGTG